MHPLIFIDNTTHSPTIQWYYPYDIQRRKNDYFSHFLLCKRPVHCSSLATFSIASLTGNIQPCTYQDIRTSIREQRHRQVLVCVSYRGTRSINFIHALTTKASLLSTSIILKCLLRQQLLLLIKLLLTVLYNQSKFRVMKKVSQGYLNTASV